MENKSCSKIPILLYHRISDDECPSELAPYKLSLKKFDQQLKWLNQNGYYSLSMEEWLYCVANNKTIDGKPVILTFDDGYLDFYENASPILFEYGFSAHVFVVTDKVGHAADWDTKYGPPAPLMTWDQIKYLDARGIGFGSHLATHIPADQLTLEILLNEAVCSKNALEENLMKTIRTLALPYGITGIEIEKTLLKAGFTQLFLTRHAIAEIHGNPAQIPRLEINGLDNIDQFYTIFNESI